MLVGFVVLSFVFLAGRMIGDPAQLMLGVEAKPADVENLREIMGLNDPFIEQYARFIGGAVTGDFGNSFWQKTPALPIVLDRLPATFLLAGAAMAVAIPFALLSGASAAFWARSKWDDLVRSFSLGGVSIVDFWFGLMLILVVALGLGWLPTSGYGGLEFLVLPALTLAIKPYGRVTQIVRSSVLDELTKPYVTAARAKGISEKRVVLVHTSKNAGLPVVTLIGDELSSLLHGAVLVEFVFGWPGVGFMLVQALERRDLPLIEATVFVMALIVIVVNLVVDLTYSVLNPKIDLEVEN